MGIFLSPSVRLTRLILVLTWNLPPLLFGVHLAGLFKNPTVSIGMIGWFIRRAVDLTWTIEYADLAGRARIVSFEWLFPLSGFRASESGIDCRVFGVVAIIATLGCDVAVR